MTRINLVPVEELSDQHLIAEYRELPRCIKQNVNTSNAPDKYCLGKGHVKWARHHCLFLLGRYVDLCKEMKFRGFKLGYGLDSLLQLSDKLPLEDFKTYHPTRQDIELSQNRIIEKFRLKPNWYKWTKRDAPKYLKFNTEKVET